jgi:membrane protein implicated in regulation of membrane protease activity
MELPVAEGYWIARFVFQRGLACIYLVAFLVAARQFRPLAGEDGLLPLSDRLDRASFRDRPSLFRLVPDDRAIAVTAWTGVALSAVALVAGPYWLPGGLATPASMALWAALWLLYLSFVNSGGTFYGYGWESMLLETGVLAVFLGAGEAAPPLVVVWLLKWVLFRNMLGAGLIKMRGDDCWRDLTCLNYYYETQPMPNPVSWYAHHLPDRFHRVETLGNHVVELAVPFLYFAPQPYAAAGGAATILFQAWLLATGNFSWLNALTVVLAVPTFDDGLLGSVLPVAAPAAAPAPTYLQIVSFLVAAVVLALSVRPVRNMLSESQRMNAGWDPLHLVNSYGAFGSVTGQRHEVVVEGTDAETPADADWEAYEFPGKPTDPGTRPPFVAPYHHRLGWQLWFAAMSPTPHRHPWFVRLLEKLLAGDEAVRSLLAADPFDGDAPEYVRAVRYRYRFTTPEERAETGRWWVRERTGTYVRPVSRSDLETGGTGWRL